MTSTRAILIVSLIWFLLGAFYYPKWSKPWSEATISWDVSGYYHYLPGIFIYHDVKEQLWMDEINKKYLPSPAYDQAFIHQPSGNKVNKYAIGQAVLYSPFFFLGHAFAKLTGAYPADGYSKPYQVAIWLGSLLFCILGLILLRRILLHYFDETVTARTILAIGLATNYMEYASITNAMNHGWLFTLLCALILFSIRFYKEADWKSACGIGISLGLAILTRPTEITWTIIPLLWGITSIKERVTFLRQHWNKILAALFLCGVIISIQPIYWKYVANEWLIYTYGDQGFNWFHPKVWRGLVGVNIGWWTYTPIMLLAMLSWYGLYKKYKSVFWPIFITSFLAIYITLCWKHFESGGGLGQRNLIQIYPLLSFPLAMTIAWILKRKAGTWIWAGIFLLNVYYNAWWIHQAHKGGFFQAGQMNTPYFFKVVGRLHPKTDYFKLLDTHEYFDGTPVSFTAIFENNFDADTTANSVVIPTGGKAIVFSADHQLYGPISLPLTPACSSWLRLEADFTIQSHEWEVWKYAQWIVQFYDGDTVIKTNLIRVQRLIPSDQTPTPLFFDVKVPVVSFTKCTMTVWNGSSPQMLWMDNLKVSCFRP
jgi:hypothetical protein